MDLRVNPAVALEHDGPYRSTAASATSGFRLQRRLPEGPLPPPDGQPGLHLCAGYPLFFRHADEPMRVMAVRRGEDARGIRDWYAGKNVTPEEYRS